MQIQASALERVRGCRLDPNVIASIYERMLNDVRVLGVKATELTLDWQDYNEPVAEGDMVPVMVLCLRPAIKEPPPEIEIAPPT